MKTKKVLVLDSELINCFLMEKFLRREGYCPLITSSSLEAWDFWQHDQVDLAIFDMDIPGVDGLALLERIREQDSKMRVIMLTGFWTPEKVARVDRLNVFTKMNKPFELDELRYVVQKALA